MKEVRPLRAYAEVALGRQRSPAHDSGPHMVRYLRAANVKDGVLDLSDVKEMNFDPKEQSVFGLRNGDVLVTEGSGSLRAVGAASVWSAELPGTVCFQNTLLRLRPRPSTDPRFLAWWCRYAFGDGLFASIATGANIFHISADRVRALPMAYLALEQQRAIADYLDTETTRIDALIAKKRELTDCAMERFDAWRDWVLVESAAGAISPLQRLTDPARPIVYGIVQAGPEVPGGVPYIKTGDMADLRPDRLSRTSAEIDEAYRRARVKPGDLVMAMRASIGHTVRVPPDLPVANLTQGTARVSPAKCVDGDWLYHALQSRTVQEQCRNRAVGTTFKTLNIWDLRRIDVPTPPSSEQAGIASRITSEALRIDLLVQTLNRQIDLLVEHRQALITAAVTGELEIPGVAA